MAKRLCDPTSGKIGSQIYLLGRNGQVVRNRVIPANPNTARQQIVRGQFSQQSARWDAIDDVERAAWIAAAADQQTRARLGMSGPMTGNQLFVRVNTNLLQLGEDVVDVPPAVPAIGLPAPAGLVITNAAGVITLKLTCPNDPSENTFLMGGAPQRAGVSRPPSMPVLGIVPAPSQGSANITGLYTTRWGVPGVGTRVFIRCQLSVCGYDGPTVTFDKLVPIAA